MGWDNLQLTSEIYNSIIKFLLKKYSVIIVGGINDKKYNLLISKNFKNYNKFYNLTGETSFNELNDLILNSRLVIASENGIAHLTASLNKMVYVIYTFSDPLVYKWENNYHYYHNKKYTCMPCISLPSAPVDNYPVICKYNYRCNESVQPEEIITELINIGL